MKQIFVFGSNLAGRHGAGSALEAVKNHGAIYGIPWGLQGNSYGIPTKDANLKVLPISSIAWHIEVFEMFALTTLNSHVFNVVEIGCGLAGYTPKEIAPLFKYRTSIVILPNSFLWSNLND